MAKIKGSRKKSLLDVPEVAADMPESFEMFASLERPNRLGNQGGSGEAKEIRFSYINDGILPYNESDGWISIRDTIELCQKAYANCSAFGNTIDIMTEFANSTLHWRGGNKVSNKFFSTWSDAINLWGFNDQFFREYYRGANCIFFRLETELTPDDINGYKEIKAKINFDDSGSIRIPRGYVILNPADIWVRNDLNYQSPVYARLLTTNQLQRLNPTNARRTEQDKFFYEALTEESKKLISGNLSKAYIPLDPKFLYTVFYKKQPYEPLSIPFGYRVLDDINFKMEMRKTDMVIARTVEQAVLLITMGESPKDGGMGVNPLAQAAMKNIFRSESLGRVIVSDYTTKAQFILPDIGSILGPEKYEQVDKDIKEGLMNIFLGEESFSNSMTKIKVFMKRLNNGRQAYLNDFLIPEVKRLHRIMGFKGVPPTPYFEEEDLKDEAVYARIYTTLLQTGALTPDECFTAIDTGTLPDKETSIQNQRELKKLKDEGLYLPNINVKDPGEKSTAGTGRPAGSTGSPSKKSTTRIVGSTQDEGTFALPAIIEVRDKASEVLSLIGKKYCEDNKIKKITAKVQEKVFIIAKNLFYNEIWTEWTDKYLDYYKNPKLPNIEIIAAVEEIIEEHNLEDELLGIILLNSKREFHKEEGVE